MNHPERLHNISPQRFAKRPYARRVAGAAVVLAITLGASLPALAEAARPLPLVPPLPPLPPAAPAVPDAGAGTTTKEVSVRTLDDGRVETTTKTKTVVLNLADGKEVTKTTETTHVSGKPNFSFSFKLSTKSDGQESKKEWKWGGKPE